jgi:peroxiredoxin
MQSIPQEETQQPEDAHVRTSSDIRVPASTPPGGKAPRRNKAASLVIGGPASGHHLHAFTLPDSTGQPVQLWQYLQRSNVMLFSHHGINCPACEAFLHVLAAQLDAYRQEETAVVAIGPDEPAENRQLAARLGQPFSFLSDPAGRVIAHQGLAPPHSSLQTAGAKSGQRGSVEPPISSHPSRTSCSGSRSSRHSARSVR